MIATLPTPQRGLAGDPAVPFRDALLDGDLLAERLRAATGARVGSCACVHAKYRPGVSLRATYRVDVEGRRHWLAARTFAPERVERAGVKAAAAATAAAGDLPAVIALPELSAVLWSFPNDRRIAGLPVLAGGPALDNLLGGRGLRCELVAWAAEKTATARCIDTGGATVAYVKAYGPRRGLRAGGIWGPLAAAAAAGGLRAPRLPRVLAHDPQAAVLALEPIAGEPLLAHSGIARAQAMERLGVALGLLHELDVPAELPPFDRLVPERLAAAAQAIGRAQPAVAARAQELAARIVASAGPTETPVVLHGDAHPGNVIAADGRVAFVDLDLAAAGPPAGDLGLVLAGLRQERVAGRLDPAAEAHLGQRVLAGYAQVRPVPSSETLHRHAAGWLLARPALPGAVAGRVRAATLDHIPALVAAGEELVA